MNAERAWFAFAILAGAGLALQTLAPPDLSRLPESSFDTAPRGNAAIFELLSRFDRAKGRWVSGLSMPPESDTIWWISPDAACESDAANDGDAKEGALGSPFRITVRPWIEAGGTALIWLPHPPLSDASEDEGEEDEAQDPEAIRQGWAQDVAEYRAWIENGSPETCASILGFDLPPRSHLGREGGQPPEEGRYSPVVFSVGRAVVPPAAFDHDAARTLPGPTLAAFDPPTPTAAVDSAETAWAHWMPRWIEADTRAAIAIELGIGEGRLIVVSDSRIISNARLAHVDSAPFAMDWVAELGAPWIDEHAHGVVAEMGTFRYLLTSPAWAACAGIAALGLLFVWRGQAWPRRVVEEADAKAPTLGDYVDSVAALYGQSQDHRAVFERYREVCLERVRRALGLSPGTPSEIILASLRVRGKNWPALREAGLAHLLTKEIHIASAQDLDRNAARLDELVRVVKESGRAARVFAADGRGGDQ